MVWSLHGSFYQFTKIILCAAPQNGNGVAEAQLFTQLPVSINVIVEKFFLRLLKYTIQAG
jgi:hypothetical protein